MINSIVLNKILVMANDTNDVIRKQCGKFFIDFLEPIYIFKKKNKEKRDELVESTASLKPLKPVKITRERFKGQFYDVMTDLTQDEEVLVSIEGVELMTKYLTLLSKDKVVQDYVPNVERLFKRAMDPATVDEVRIRMTNLSGKIYMRFESFKIALEY